MKLLKQAASQLGVKEIRGDDDNPQILRYAEESGIPGISNDETAWCSIFINWCAAKAGLPKSGKANARSWLNVGIPIQSPQPGDLVVFWREDPHSWKGHVGVFLGYKDNGSRVFCLGGNQGDLVSITDYDANKILGYRRIEKPAGLVIPEPKLEKPDYNSEVAKLQTILNFLGFNCGDVDMDFGTKTENAVKLLQANNQLSVNGIYDQDTKNIIESLLQS